MRIVGEYSFNGGKEAVYNNYPEHLEDVKQVISRIDAAKCLTKEAKEKTMLGKMLYSPRDLNSEFKKHFAELNKGWSKYKIDCAYSTDFYINGYRPPPHRGQMPYREMDFLRDKLGVEVQFGKYAFMVYNVAAKMTIFRNLNIIDTGIEIVPIKSFADNMSTGVSYFEQFVWDLQKRGTSNIDVPVLILGIVGDEIAGEPIPVVEQLNFDA